MHCRVFDLCSIKSIFWGDRMLFKHHDMYCAGDVYVLPLDMWLQTTVASSARQG